MVVCLLIVVFVLNNMLIPLHTMEFILKDMSSMITEDANHNKS